MLKTNKHKISESEFWKKTPIKTIAGCICLAFSVLVGIYFGTTSPFSIIFSILCLFLAIGFFVAEIFTRAKHMYDEKLSVTAADEKYFEDAEVIPVFSTEKMFRSATERSELSFQTHDCESSTPFDISPDYTSELLNVVNEFVLFAEENGCKIDISTAKSILASIASSIASMALSIASLHSSDLSYLSEPSIFSGMLSRASSSSSLTLSSLSRSVCSALLLARSCVLLLSFMHISFVIQKSSKYYWNGPSKFYRQFQLLHFQ